MSLYLGKISHFPKSPDDLFLTPGDGNQRAAVLAFVTPRPDLDRFDTAVDMGSRPQNFQDFSLRSK